MLSSVRPSCENSVAWTRCWTARCDRVGIARPGSGRWPPSASCRRRRGPGRGAGRRGHRDTRQRHVTGFFQGNRYLLPQLVDRVLREVPEGPMADLYAGSGLFGLAHAAVGPRRGDAVEGDRRPSRTCGPTRRRSPARSRWSVHPWSSSRVRHRPLSAPAVLVDPPRTGLCRVEADALTGPPVTARLVYISCDIATLARDARTLADGGFRLRRGDVRSFPNTAHVETVMVSIATEPCPISGIDAVPARCISFEARLQSDELCNAGASRAPKPFSLPRTRTASAASPERSSKNTATGCSRRPTARKRSSSPTSIKVPWTCC